MHDRTPVAAPHLIEREVPLSQLSQCLQSLAMPGASGRCLLLQGEAGVGKTSLLRAARQLAPPGVDWLTGLCEPLLSPTPLGPLIDMLDDLPPGLSSLVRSGRPAQDVMPELLAWLRRLGSPLVLVIDDVQWADGASLDLLRFIGRRIEGLRLLLVLSYRDDELPADHPLRGVIGGLPPAATVRLALAPLSPKGVDQAARRAGRPARGLHLLTQGNPFFVTELLAAPRQTFPASVRDAVLARVQRLSAPARHLLELASVSPVAVERGVLCGPADAAGIDQALTECLASGLLIEQGESLGFKHELARRAVESALDAARRRRLHRQMLLALPEASATRRVHHAEGAGLAGEVLALAPRAAADAARACAHRQAGDLYELALSRCNAHTPGAERAALLAAWAEQCEMIAALERARAARIEAIALHRQLGDRVNEGLGLCRMARLQFLLGDIAAGKRLALEAIQVLEPLGQPRELGLAYAVMAQLHLLDETHAAARDWGQRAMALAEACNDSQTLAHALNTVGASVLAGGDHAAAWAQLRHSLALSLTHGWAEHAARAYSNLIVHALVHRKQELWSSLCDEAETFFEARDLDLYVTRLRIRRAYGELETGRWERAEAQLRDLLAQPGLVEMDREQATHLLALLGLRRGGRADGSEVQSYWAELLGGQRSLNPKPWYAPMAVASAEAAWLLGRPDDLLRVVAQAWPTARATGEPWRCGQLAVWRHRMGQLARWPDLPLAPPCEAELRGDLDGAAQAWADVGNPYEQAVCLLGGQVAQLRRALALFEQLGALTGAALARRRLRELGEATGLRGLNKATRADPLGLTPRERALLNDLALGLSDRAIALRWHRSSRTVEHHVASLLKKLGLHSRREVAAYAVPHPAAAD